MLFLALKCDMCVAPTMHKLGNIDFPMVGNKKHDQI